MRGLLLVSFVFLLLVLTPSPVSAQSEETLEGVVTKIIEEKFDSTQDGVVVYQRVQVKVDKGSLEGSAVEVESQPGYAHSSFLYKVEDRVVVARLMGFGEEELYYITDFVRRDQLLLLFVFFAGLVILVGRVWGVTSLVGMGFSFVVIFAYILPRIIAGDNPVLAAIIGSGMIIPVTFTLSHGLSKKTVIAGVSTVITLGIVGLLSVFFVNETKLSGYSTEEAGFLHSQISTINMRGILLAGIIIATLGVLDDITISQASVVAELKRVNKKLKPQEVFKSAMRVGRDHIASLVNTLVLVYAGASLPLFLLFIQNPKPFSEVVNYEIIAEEVVRTLVGSIGLVLAVPITTILAVYYLKKE